MSQPKSVPLHWLAATVRKLDKIICFLLEDFKPEPKSHVLCLNELIPETSWKPNLEAAEFVPCSSMNNDLVELVESVEPVVSAAPVESKEVVPFEKLPSVGTWLALPPPLKLSGFVPTLLDVEPHQRGATMAMPTQADLIGAFKKKDYIGCADCLRANGELRATWEVIIPHLLSERDVEIMDVKRALDSRVDLLESKQSEWAALQARAAAAADRKQGRKVASQLLREVEDSIAAFQPEKESLEKQIRDLRRGVVQLELVRKVFAELLAAILEGDNETILASSSQLSSIIPSS